MRTGHTSGSLARFFLDNKTFPDNLPFIWRLILGAGSVAVSFINLGGYHIRVMWEELFLQSAHFFL